MPVVYHLWNNIKIHMRIQAVMVLLLACHSLAMEYTKTKMPQTGVEWLIFGILLVVFGLIFLACQCYKRKQERLERQAAEQANAQLQPQAQPQNPTNPNLINPNAQGMNPPFSAAPPQFQQIFNRPNLAPFNPYNQPMNPYINNPTGPQRF